MQDMEPIEDLTGAWRGDDGSVTYLRQVELGLDTEIFWASSCGLPPVFSNIFTGFRVGSKITGQWIDIPQTFQNQIGTLALEVIDTSTIRLVAASQAYRTKIWTKIRNGFPT